MYDCYYFILTNNVSKSIYGSETWKMTKKAKTGYYLCSIIQKTQRDKINNDGIRNILGLEELSDILESNINIKGKPRKVK